MKKRFHPGDAVYAKLVDIINDLESDEYQQVGMDVAFSDADDLSDLDKAFLIEGHIVVSWDPGCSDPECSCHTASSKEVHWLEAYQDESGEWWSQYYRSYGRY